MEMCRDRYTVLNSTIFNVYACAMCYQYLFGVNEPYFRVLKDAPFYGAMLPYSWTPDSQNVTEPEVVYPDISNASIKHRVCSTLQDGNCKRWTDCCTAAIQCCQDQLTTPPLETDTTYCPRTWDGFRCVKDTPPGKTAFLQCPTYIEYSFPDEWARKTCTQNGSWYEVDGQEWTDYTPCIRLQDYRRLFYVAVSCHMISLILTMPASLVFLAFRQLRKQHRVQIHLNLFLSFMLTNVVWTLWEYLVYNDRLENVKENSLMRKDTPGCKLLYSLTRYALSANYFWMFLEGVHLLRLMVNAFVLPANMVWYFVCGWAGPLVFLLIYIGFRIYQGQGGCWVKGMDGYEWWIYTPNLAILLLNVVSLGWIIFTLTTQIQVHPNEPSSYRRALKAMVVLTPLFGLQMVFVIYRPSRSANSHALEITASIFKSSQGALVALIFCYFNKEVRTQFQTYFKNLKQRLPFGWTPLKRHRRQMDSRTSLNKPSRALAQNSYNVQQAETGVMLQEIKQTIVPDTE